MPADSSSPNPHPAAKADAHTAADATATPDGYDLVLEQEGRRWVFRVRPGQEAEVLARLTVMADDPDEPLTWYQAALLSDQLGQALRHRLSDHQRQIQTQRPRSAATG